jgi:hypothetical protein
VAIWWGVCGGPAARERYAPLRVHRTADHATPLWYFSTWDFFADASVQGEALRMLNVRHSHTNKSEISAAEIVLYLWRSLSFAS